ncbi:MAG: serine/threonine-protein phosphatase [Hamadaea sp.]|nr:serine/threonine-protein phosphatase [Hamadaea sp.]
MSLTLRSALVSDLGLIRMNNEDSAHAGSRLLVIADGVGGAPAGEDASAIVTRELTELETAELTPDPGTALLDRLMAANRKIYEATVEDPEKEGMGTTMTAVLLSADADDAAEVTIAHVGDSRAYLLRDGELRRLTRDDTYVQSLIDRGVLSEDDARHHPQKSLITQSVQGLDFTAARSTLTIQPGDRFLLCSDGLSDIVTDHSIARAMLSQAEVQQCAEQLVKLALQAGAPDNVTVIIADVVAVEATTTGARRLPGVSQLASWLGIA